MRSLGVIVLTVLIAVVAVFVVDKRMRESHSRRPTEPAQATAAISDNGLLMPTRDAESGVRVIDGDTIVIDGERIRLFGIDAPERSQPCSQGDQATACGQEAGRVLAQLIGGERPSCVARSADRYGRTVAVCSVNGKDLGREMVAGGWAVAFTRYSQDYSADEAAARDAHRGIWQGRFERPDIWRAEHR